MEFGFDILLDNNDDLIIENGDLVIGESTLQEVGIIARLTQGDLKSDPILGPNLFMMINSKASQIEILTKLKLHLARDGKDYNLLQDYIRINTKYL